MSKVGIFFDKVIDIYDLKGIGFWRAVAVLLLISFFIRLFIFPFYTIKVPLITPFIATMILYIPLDFEKVSFSKEAWSYRVLLTAIGLIAISFTCVVNSMGIVNLIIALITLTVASKYIRVFKKFKDENKFSSQNDLTSRE